VKGEAGRHRRLVLAGGVARLHQQAPATRGTALHQDLLHAVLGGIDVLVAPAARTDRRPARLADRAAALAAAVDDQLAGERAAIVVEADVVPRGAVDRVTELLARRVAEHALERELQLLAADGRLLDQRRRGGGGHAAGARRRVACGQGFCAQSDDRQAREKHGDTTGGPCPDG
jgi:hypothetical protein